MSIISIIIPLYNKAAHIKRALKSVIKQGIKDIEILVVNDASTDGGEKLIGEFNDSRIKLYHRSEPGPGGYAARNLGILNAKSPWIAFLDADDEWLEDHLSNFMDALQQNPEIELYGAAYKKSFGDGNFKICKKAVVVGEDTDLRLISFDEFLESIVNTEQVIWTSATIVKREAFSKAGDFPAGRTRRGGDTDTWLRLANTARHIGWNPKVSVIYHLDADNRVTQTARNFEKTSLITETCDRIISQGQSAYTTKLLKRVQAQKYYELCMARKRYSNVMFSSLPDTRAYYFIVHPKTILCLMPDFIYRMLKKLA